MLGILLFALNSLPFPLVRCCESSVEKRLPIPALPGTAQQHGSMPVSVV